jgi:Domain of unknown function (DUF5615)
MGIAPQLPLWDGVRGTGPPALDDDSADPLLARLLRNAGHDVRLTSEIAQVGSPDAAHLKYAVGDIRVLLTGNHDDFEILHDLILEALGHHPGILVVRRDNDPRRDLTPRGIVRAVAKLVAASFTMRDQLQILNHWR